MKKQQKKEFKQVQNQAQEGRSMVEMLGVLAIIGVLSIGGIAGYRWGMDKHITNQILYEMNLNSAQLAMLLQRGNADGVTLSLGSPYDEGNFRTLDYGFEYGCGEYATCGHACQYPDETMYFITATGLPKRVCNMLGDAVFGMAYYYDSEINENDECKDTDNTVTVFFNTNATANGEASPRPENPDNPYTPTPEVTAATPTTATTLAPTTAPTTLAPTTAPTTLAPTTAPTTIPPISATPFVSTTMDLFFCNEGGSACGNGCDCPEGWMGKNCEEKGEKECSSNSECENGYYCRFNHSNICSKQEGEKGYCQKNTGITVNGGFLVKQEKMTWWSAQNFCLSHGKSMASLSDLKCSHESEDQIRNSTSVYSAKCYQTGTSGAISGTFQDLQEGMEGNYFYWAGGWLSGDGLDDCHAYYLENGYAGKSSRDWRAFAVCKL